MSISRLSKHLAALSVVGAVAATEPGPRELAPVPARSDTAVASEIRTMPDDGWQTLGATFRLPSERSLEAISNGRRLREGGR